MDRGGGPSLRTRVTLLAVVGLVLLGLIALLVWAAYADVRRTGDDVALRLSPAADLSADLVVAYDRIDRESRAFVLTGDPTAKTRYDAARERAVADTEKLRPLLAPDPSLAADLVDVTAAAENWIPPVVEPAVAARTAGPLTVEQLQDFIAASTSAFQPVSTATDTLQESVNDARDAAFDDLTAVARRLALALTLAGFALLALVSASYLLVRRWVLTPLDDLSGQLRDVASGARRERVIEPSGPPELRAVGADAESMRRSLLAQTDAARAADESLAMQGPVVAAVRADLATETDPVAAHLSVHGELHPAEGVLAGDWWGDRAPRRRAHGAARARRLRPRAARRAGDHAPAGGHDRGAALGLRPGDGARARRDLARRHRRRPVRHGAGGRARPGRLHRRVGQRGPPGRLAAAGRQHHGSGPAAPHGAAAVELRRPVGHGPQRPARGRRAARLVGRPRRDARRPTTSSTTTPWPAWWPSSAPASPACSCRSSSRACAAGRASGAATTSPSWPSAVRPDRRAGRPMRWRGAGSRDRHGHPIGLAGAVHDHEHLP